MSPDFEFRTSLGSYFAYSWCWTVYKTGIEQSSATSNIYGKLGAAKLLK